MDKLGSNGREEQGRAATVAFAPLEEEACSERASNGEVLSHSARNRRLSSASHTVQPEYAFTVRVIGPPSYLMKEIDSSIRMASRFVRVGVRVERGTVRDRQLREVDLLVDPIKLATQVDGNCAGDLSALSICRR